jgi:hypothetical protein
MSNLPISASKKWFIKTSQWYSWTMTSYSPLWNTQVISIDKWIFIVHVFYFFWVMNLNSRFKERVSLNIRNSQSQGKFTGNWYLRYADIMKSCSWSPETTRLSVHLFFLTYLAAASQIQKPLKASTIRANKHVQYQFTGARGIHSQTLWQTQLSFLQEPMVASHENYGFCL